MRRRLARWLRELAGWMDPPPFFERVRLGDGFATTPSGTTKAKLTTWTGRNDG